MLKTDRPQNEANDTLAAKSPFEYYIQPGDKFKISIYPNKGYQLTDIVALTSGSRNELVYLVKENGFAHLPVIDSFKMSGLTTSQAEDALKSYYSIYFINPFIKIEITNRRVTVFRGRGIAVPVELANEHMNLLEVIGRAGGLTNESKAAKIKIVRGNLKNPIIKFIDLSTVSAMSKEDLRVFPNDIIYIEPQFSFNAVEAQLIPAISVLSSIFLIYSIVKQAK